MVSALQEICYILREGRNGIMESAVKEVIAKISPIQQALIPGSVLAIGGIFSNLQNTILHRRSYKYLFQ